MTGHSAVINDRSFEGYHYRFQFEARLGFSLRFTLLEGEILTRTYSTVVPLLRDHPMVHSNNGLSRGVVPLQGEVELQNGCGLINYFFVTLRYRLH